MVDGLRERYDSEAGAAAYAGKYDRGLLRRLSGRRELRLARWALEAAGVRGGVVLDVPCGAGRLTPILLERFDRVTGLDRSPSMVALARERHDAAVEAGRAVFGEGDATALPFPDGAFAAALCWRLVHHLTDRADRVRVLKELGRVTRGPVVCSFADASTWKSRLQRWRGRNRRCAKATPAEFAAEGADAGLALVSSRRLSSLFSLLGVAVFTRGGSGQAL